MFNKGNTKFELAISEAPAENNQFTEQLFECQYNGNFNILQILQSNTNKLEILGFRFKKPYP